MSVRPLITEQEMYASVLHEGTPHTLQFVQAYITLSQTLREICTYPQVMLSVIEQQPNLSVTVRKENLL